MATTQPKTIEIEVIAKLIEMKDENGKIKNSFYSYKAVTQRGKLVDLRFTREVKNAPIKDCIIVVPSDKANYAKNTKYPKLWINEVLEVKDSRISNEVDQSVLDDFNSLPF